MKKILILSYHSLPFDTIASYRAMAYLRYLRSEKFEATMVSHNWENWEIERPYWKDEQFGSTIHRIPLKLNRFERILKKIESYSIFNKLGILTRWTSGYLDNIEGIASYRSYKSFCFQELKSRRYDLVLGIFSPHHHLRLCYELNKKFGIPYVLDFRDLWHNRILHKKYSPNLTERIQDYFTKYYWKKWLSNSCFFCSTSSNLVEKISEITLASGKVLHNGFDPELFNNFSPQGNKKAFTIIHGGSLYSHQELGVFLKGCKLFLDQRKPEFFKVKFIGAQNKHAQPNQLSGFLHKPKEVILSVLGQKYCEVTKRIPKVELAKEIEQCQILLFPGMLDSPGIHLGKIFDYIASKRNILMAPDDCSVVGELIRKTQTGYICNTPEEVCDQLTKCYQEWKTKGYLDYLGNQKEIFKYSRESQVRKMAAYLDEII